MKPLRGHRPSARARSASHAQFADPVSSKARKVVAWLLCVDEAQRPTAEDATRRLCEIFKQAPPAAFAASDANEATIGQEHESAKAADIKA